MSYWEDYHREGCAPIKLSAQVVQDGAALLLTPHGDYVGDVQPVLAPDGKVPDREDFWGLAAGWVKRDALQAFAVRAKKVLCESEVFTAESVAKVVRGRRDVNKTQVTLHHGDGLVKVSDTTFECLTQQAGIFYTNTSSLSPRRFKVEIRIRPMGETEIMRPFNLKEAEFNEHDLETPDETGDRVDDPPPELPTKEPRKDDESVMSKGRITEIAYRVEVRTRSENPSDPVRLQDGIVTEKWRTVQFTVDRNAAGVPEAFGHSRLHGILPLESAKALAWTIIAQNPHKGVMTRLRRHRLQTNHVLIDEGIVEGTVFQEEF